MEGGDESVPIESVMHVENSHADEANSALAALSGSQQPQPQMHTQQ